MPNDNPDNPILTPKEAAALLKVKPEWLSRNRLSRNSIPYIKLGRQVRYYQCDSIQRIPCCK